MSARHEHLLAALGRLLAAIEHEDANGAAVAMEDALQLFATTSSPADDERLAPMMARCEAAARTFHSRLGAAVRDTATGARAIHSYATGGRKEQP